MPRRRAQWSPTPTRSRPDSPQAAVLLPKVQRTAVGHAEPDSASIRCAPPAMSRSGRPNTLGLVVPGVSVETTFDVLPPLPAAAGIVGVVGIVDRPPADGGLVSVTRVSELQDLLGPGSIASIPEAVSAISTGAQEL